jgi:hypothetical protein
VELLGDDGELIEVVHDHGEDAARYCVRVDPIGTLGGD